jgi:EmrB/QacA subfamily drug resistance transporter
MSPTIDVKNIRFWPVMIAIFFGSFLTILSISMINIALPVLMEDFHTSLNTIQWTLTGFMLSLGTVAPLSGYLGDKFGYKKVYLVAIIGFTIFSLLCGLAWSALSLIIFRIIQGIFSGLVLPATMTIIFQVVPKPKQAYAVSLWALSAMLAPAFGPTISGWLIQYFSWNWLFLCNVPIGILAIVLIIFMIPDYRISVAKSLDVPGLITVVLSSLSLLVALSEGHAWGWTSWRVVGLILFGLLNLALFIWRELQAAEPLLNLRVLKNTRYTITLVTTTIVTISLYSGTFLTPLFLQNVQHVTPLDTGLILLPASLAMAISMPIIGKLYTRLGPRMMSIPGILLIALGTLAVSWLSTSTPHAYIIFWMAVRNLGIAMTTMPTSNAGMEEISPMHSGHASAISNWVRNVFGSFAIALFSSMLATYVPSHAAELAKQGVGSKQTIQLLSFTMSVNDVYLVATIISLIALPFTFLVGKQSDKKVSKLSQEVA